MIDGITKRLPSADTSNETGECSVERASASIVKSASGLPALAAPCQK